MSHNIQVSLTINIRDLAGCATVLNVFHVLQDS